MEGFLSWLNSDEAEKLHPIKYAALAHYKFVFIHPFVDGNGRTARLLMNFLLMQVGNTVFCILLFSLVMPFVIQSTSCSLMEIYF